MFASLTTPKPAHALKARKAISYPLKRGAAYDLFLAAGNGRMDLIKPMFDEKGHLREDAPRVPGLNEEESPQHRINWAFFIAAQAGEVEILEFLHPNVTEYVTLPDGATALDRALAGEHTKAIEWLKAKDIK